MRRLQVYLPEDLLLMLRIYAKNRGIPMAEALRRAGSEFAAKPNIKKEIRKLLEEKRKTAKDPLIAMAGMLEGGPKNASTSVDEIYR